MTGNSLPLVSIITITYNSASTVRDTLESVLSQSYQNLEYILVDGNSTDDTLAILNAYLPEFKKRNIPVSLVSEPDDGIADAWNKGIEMSSGQIVAMLNSDDWFEENAVEKAVNCLDIHKAQLSYGICKRVDQNGDIIETMKVTFKPRRIYLNFGFSFTTCFLTRRLLEEVGGFDPRYRIAIDVDFLLRALHTGDFIRCENITFMRLGGVSTKYEYRALQEYQQALKSNRYNPILVGVFGWVKRGYLFLRKLKT